MRIAQVAPLFESVPPSLYGGTERVVSYLTEELVSLGHDVTLFASADSVTSARLVPSRARSLRLDPALADPIAAHVLMVEQVIQRAAEFDVVHFHIDAVHFPLMRRLGIPHLTTLHGRQDVADLAPLYREFADMPLVSISESQRVPLPHANWLGTVYHGLPAGLYHPGKGDGGYLAFVGRISPEKRFDRAFAIAKAVQMPLMVAAKIGDVDHDYFEREIEALLADPLVTYLGEIGDGEKERLLGGAKALLFPVDWPEPFGIVLIEALACGTPVIAFREGSVPEVIEDGVSGYVVDSVDGAIEAVRHLDSLDRAGCRELFERRFSALRMAEDYLAIYDRIRRNDVAITEDASEAALASG